MPKLFCGDSTLLVNSLWIDQKRRAGGRGGRGITFRFLKKKKKIQDKQTNGTDLEIIEII